MITWTINLNGRPYSIEHPGRKIKAEQVVEIWKANHIKLGYTFPPGNLTATRYVESRLDRYGTRRGG